jgi:DNA repair protein RecO (recombination protein O)
MPQKQSEAIVLRTYPLREADLLVTLFTRQEGKLRGVAKSAKKSKRRFGGALEPLTYIRAYWEDKAGTDLARLDSCDVLDSPLSSRVDYERAAALAHVAEVIDELMPDREHNDAVFRLSVTALQKLQAGAVWLPLTYFDLWIARLTGLLPELNACMACGEVLNGSKAWFHPLQDGLMCANDKRLASSEMSAESRKLAAEMFRRPLEKMGETAWPRQRAADLRKYLVQLIERHIEKKLVTATILERME